MPQSKPFLFLTALVIFLAGASPNAFAWCWVRSSGVTGSNCSEDVYQQACCDGDLRVWPSAGMTYKISTSTAGALYEDIRRGFNLWNAVVMSLFTFLDGGTTTTANAGLDGTNMVAIDSGFCTRYGYCGMGVLGFSMTWTSTSGGYHAVESDISMNGEEFSWGDGSGGTINTVGVVAHEAGHSAGVTHPGSTCRQSGSAGCGPEFPAATMYFSYSGGQPTDKGDLELDDVASLVYGYPRAVFRVQVVDHKGAPVAGAAVQLVGTATPVNGAGIETGGSVVGDIDASFMGDEVPSDTYVSTSPFDDTDAGGFTNSINPVHQSFRVRATHNNRSVTRQVTVVDGESTLVVRLASPLPAILQLLLG